MTSIATSRAIAGPGNPITRMLRQLGIDSGYVLAGFPLAVAGFCLVVTGLSVGAGLLITVIGLPVLVGTGYAARGLAFLERVRLAPVIRRPALRVSYRTARPEAGWWRRMATPLADPQTWLDLLHAIVRLPVATAGFSIVVTWWAGAVAGLSYWFWQGLVPSDEHGHDLPELLGLGNSVAARSWFYLSLGVFLALTLPPMVRACALAEAWLANGLLCSVAQLRQQVTGLAQERATALAQTAAAQAQTAAAQAQTAAAVSAEAIALHRLERDIHDGPQQRLVRLAVDLGRAQRQLDSDPGAARGTVTEALAQTREALAELRGLSRGIAPPILTDRGLEAALTALAARCTVPVTLDLDPVGRLPAVAEHTAYFTVAEALTNVAKHAGASLCTVGVRLDGQWLAVSVTDTGLGGAHLAKGHGLAGLADRVQAAGGRLSVVSPPGGPTEIRAELPCPTVV
jgi:signal transduction histidine kinase